MTSCKPPPTCIDASPIPDANDSRMSAIPYEANLTPMGASPLRYSTDRWLPAPEIKEMLRRHRHAPIDEQGKWLGTVIKGYFAYFAVPTNTYPLSAFRYHISLKWFQSLRRRSQRRRLTWERMSRLITRFLPSPRVLHPWPDQRFGVTYSR